MATVLLDGVAYGMLLFVLASGLVITLGILNFVNLAHGVFAMLGGYLAIGLVGTWHLPFLAALPVVFVATAIAGIAAERLIYRHAYAKSHLDQVLLTIGLVFMATAAVDWTMGSAQRFVEIPDALKTRLAFLGMNIGAYRLFIIAVCLAVTGLLFWILAFTRQGARLRAVVDDPRAAAGLGINVGGVFAAAFAVGSGLAGVGGAIGAEILGLDPSFPLKFMVYFLMVVTLGGRSRIFAPFVAAMMIGILDVAGKYFFPELGNFVVYTIMVAALILRPNGLFGA